MLIKILICSAVFILGFFLSIGMLNYLDTGKITKILPGRTKSAIFLGIECGIICLLTTLIIIFNIK